MGQILEQVVDFFEKENWQFSKIEDEPALQTAFTSDQGTWLCFAQAVEDEATQRFFFYSVCPLKAQDHMPAVAEFITRANYGLSIGNFELDFADGEIRFKTSIDVTEDGFGLATIERLVYTNVLMMDRYLPGLMTILSGSASPEQAIQAIESVPEPVEA
ncbi:MAG: YbjN domain-containing protein [Coleofasciculus sp. G1-WW12-02]|uniref:YbjN domain-containing protein n=1 Tax=Coleofasciculus sp. G1-WW12-02 TaxID=3068483 RepID=UPI0032FAFC10